jgi:transposase
VSYQDEDLEEVPEDPLARSLIDSHGVRIATAVTLISNGASHREAARELGISSNTVSKLVQTKEFQDQIRHVLKERREKQENRLQRLVDKALDRAEAILDNPDAPEWATLRAVENILTRAGFNGPADPAAAGAGSLAIVADLFQQRLAVLHQPGAAPPPPGGGLGPDRGMPNLPPGRWHNDRVAGGQDHDDAF